MIDSTFRSYGNDDLGAKTCGKNGSAIAARQTSLSRLPGASCHRAEQEHSEQAAAEHHEWQHCTVLRRRHQRCGHGPTCSAQTDVNFRSRLGVARRIPLAATCCGSSRLAQSALLYLCLLSVFAATQLQPRQHLVAARSIDDSPPPNGRVDEKTNALDDIQRHRTSPESTTTASTTSSRSATHRHAPISDAALSEFIERVTAVFTSTTPAPATTTTTTTSTAASTLTAATSLEATPTSETAKTTDNGEEDLAIPDEDDQSSGAESDDNDAEDCQGLSSGASAPGKGPSDNERLVRLQACLEKKVKRQMKSTARNTIDLFHELSLSGACTASLVNLMASLGELKGFAFKFLDASAKIPSGMMSGLLSDFGDFEQCLSIRSNPSVDPRDELEEGGYSGKYCLLNIRMQYKVKLGPNATAPEGIYPDGVLWDELVRNYWTSNSSKGFQVGICVPSRCNQDDLAQMLQLFARNYHIFGELGSCQDSNDVRRQQQPDLLQTRIIYAFMALIALALLGTGVDRCVSSRTSSRKPKSSTRTRLMVRLLTCFSLQRNWRIFLRRRCDHTPGLDDDAFDDLNGMSPLPIRTRHRRSASNNKYHSSNISMSTDTDQETGGCGSVSSPLVNRSPATSGSLLSSAPPSDNSASSQQQQHSTSVSNAKLYYEPLEFLDSGCKSNIKPLSVRIQPEACALNTSASRRTPDADGFSARRRRSSLTLSHLWGLKLLVIGWIIIGHSFLYPSANNYQHYRSIINMNITKNSVWFATTNFILGIDMLLYMAGLTFVLKLTAGGNHRMTPTGANTRRRINRLGLRVAQLLVRKVLRFWPTYLSVIGAAIVLPLVSNGPMWPEMVARRLGETCRANWWANMLMVNNLLDSGRVCLPSSWFISVIMQCFLVGAAIIALAAHYSRAVAMIATSLFICFTSSLCFWLAYTNKLNAPAIRMDESFVMELDENIFRMYTSTVSNLGPFLVGILGGLILAPKWGMCARDSDKHQLGEQIQQQETTSHSSSSSSSTASQPIIERLSRLMFELNLAFAMGLLALGVLSSVFFTNYTPFWSALYWSGHRVGWAIVTGYLVHQCATGKWLLVRDLLSLSALIPLARLIFITYLVYPMFIHMHSGLVRDGLHVSLYNMLSIYITRLVMSFAAALVLHLLVELPVCSISQMLLTNCLERRSSKLGIARLRCNEKRGQAAEASSVVLVVGQPLLATVKQPADRSAETSPDQGGAKTDSSPAR